MICLVRVYHLLISWFEATRAFFKITEGLQKSHFEKAGYFYVFLTLLLAVSMFDRTGVTLSRIVP